MRSYRGLGTGSRIPDVGHVAHQQSGARVGDLAETSIVPVAGVGGTSTHQHLGLEEVDALGQLVVVNETSLRVDLETTGNLEGAQVGMAPGHTW